MSTRPAEAAGPAGAARVLDLLSHVPMFRGLPRADLSRIAAWTATVHARRGELLFQRGDACTGFHYIAFGQVKLALTTPAGAERVIEIMGPGRTFGEAVMFTASPYPVSATVLTDSLLLHVRSQALFDGIERDPQLARRLLAALSARLHVMVKDVESLTLHSASQRVIGYLARLADEGRGAPAAATASGGAGVVNLPAQKSLVASALNLTPEYFSRILHELEADGVLRVEGRRIEILDVAALRGYGSSG